MVCLSCRSTHLSGTPEQRLAKFLRESGGGSTRFRRIKTAPSEQATASTPTSEPASAATTEAATGREEVQSPRRLSMVRILQVCVLFYFAFVTESRVESTCEGNHEGLSCGA